MNRISVIAVLVLTLISSAMFLGCATVPSEELNEKEAMIQDLNNQVSRLRQEISRLEEENERLDDIKSNLEMKLKEEMKKRESAVVMSEPKVK